MTPPPIPTADAMSLKTWANIAGSARIIAHRGAAGLWPENSLLAFNKAIAAGYDVFEIDVHGTRDRDLVVIHDLTVDRTSNGRGAVREISTADLDGMLLVDTNGEAIPHLDTILQLFHRNNAAAIVEIKFRSDMPEHDDLCQRLVEAIGQARMRATISVSAFDWRSLATVRRIDPMMNLTAVASARGLEERGGLAATAAAAAKLGARDLALEWRAVDEGTASAVRANGLRLGVWTPNEASHIARMIECDVDWIITDRPDLAPST